MASISHLVAVALRSASELNAGVSSEWLKASWFLGGLLPKSLLVSSVQDCGHLDMLLLCMENETASGLEKQPDQTESLHYQNLFSNLWVGSLYEVCRTVKERALLEDPAFLDLAHDLRLVRIPLEKYEIAADKHLPLVVEMQRQPQSANETDAYEYQRKDRAGKSHIMPTGLTLRGSITWQVIDTEAENSRWIERRELSERFRSILGRLSQLAPVPSSPE